MGVGRGQGQVHGHHPAWGSQGRGSMEQDPSVGAPCTNGGLALRGPLFSSLHAVEFTEEEQALSRKMMKYWANFARQG